MLGLKSNNKYPYKRKEEEKYTEDRVICRLRKRLEQYIWKPENAKDYWHSPEAGEKHGIDFPSEPPEEPDLTTF